MQYLIYLIILIFAELIYFKIADKYNIIDKPNHRSSHTQITIRGGGIVFPISLLLWFVFFKQQYPFFIGALFIVSVVSFIDDIKNISRRVRIIAHLVAVSAVFYQLNLFTYHWAVLIAFYIIIIGVINAYNFMDGINGITGIYSLTLIGTLFWINQYQFKFIDNSMLILLALSLLVFNFFNCRKKAMCFAGDIGSIAMALTVCFLLVKLILQTSHLAYCLMLGIYGIDAVFTIILRLLKKENIFEAHRHHLYQLMITKASYSHLSVATMYSLSQLLLNVILIIAINTQNYTYIAFVLIILIILYFFTRFKLLSPNTSTDIV